MSLDTNCLEHTLQIGKNTLLRGAGPIPRPVVCFRSAFAAWIAVEVLAFEVADLAFFCLLVTLAEQELEQNFGLVVSVPQHLQ